MTNLNDYLIFLSVNLSKTKKAGKQMTDLSCSCQIRNCVFIQGYIYKFCIKNMYNDDNSDKESEYEERSPEDTPIITKKSLSTVGFRNSMDNQAARPLAIRATQSFTGAVEELRLCGNFQRTNLSNRMNAMSVPKVGVVCPCGCLLRPAAAGPFRTRDQNTLALHVVAPDVLHYHGYSFEPTQIAMFWKKDCRMFLWKGKAKLKNVINAESHKKYPEKCFI